jgi:hypothetical protein
MTVCPRAVRRAAVLALGALLVAGGCSGSPGPVAASGSATRPGTPSSSLSGSASAPPVGWAVAKAGTPDEVEGYADHAGVLPGAPVRLFVSTTAPSFRVRAFRFGWYDGSPARLVWTSGVVPGHRQPTAVTEARGMRVAPWAPSLTFATSGWPPGSYLLRLDASSGAQRYVPLVVDSPSVAGRVVLVQPVTSYQAYNSWGGADLYNGPDGSYSSRARAVSFDRPYQSEDGAADFFQLEQPLVSLAERLGLPLAYRTGVDLDEDPHALDGAAAVVSEGHDEYWSPEMRAVLTAARDHGSDLAFFGANAVFRKIRFEDSALGRDRVVVNYKNPQEDPLYGKDDAQVTGDWPSPPDAQPESPLIGQAYACFSGLYEPLVVTDAGSWIWAGSGVRNGESLPRAVGPESDHVDPTGAGPAQVSVAAHSPVRCAFTSATSSDVTFYQAPSGAGVFATGTGGWVCALWTDACSGADPPPITQRALQAATANVLRTFARGPFAHACTPVIRCTGQ